MSMSSSVNKKRLIGGIFIVIVVVGFGIFGIGKLIQNLTRDADSEDDGKSSIYPIGNTDLNLTDIDDEFYDLADHRDKVVVLYFHFLDCGYCPANSQALKKAMRNYTSDDLLVISLSISSRDTPEELRTWADDNGYSWVNARDYGDVLSTEYNGQSTPTTVYIARDGSYIRKVGTQSEYAHKTNINKMLDFD